MKTNKSCIMVAMRVMRLNPLIFNYSDISFYNLSIFKVKFKNYSFYLKITFKIATNLFLVLKIKYVI